MNIAIVDEEKIELETAETFLRFYIRKFFPERQSQIHIEIFRRAEDFLQVFSAGWYHVIILGARMESIAQVIRGRGDGEVKIIFLQMNDNFGGGGIYEHRNRGRRKI